MGTEARVPYRRGASPDKQPDRMRRIQMAKTVFRAEMDKWPEDQAIKTHNRWAPRHSGRGTVQAGGRVSGRMLRLDGRGRSATTSPRTTSATSICRRSHYLSGPFGVDGAEPGDLLVVDINDIGSLEDSQWGFTGIFALENGGGFLDRHYPAARKACWDFHGVYTSSRHIPGVRFPGLIHPGLIGTLPSAELLAKWNSRENALFQTDPDRVPPLCTLPDGLAAHTHRPDGGR